MTRLHHLDESAHHLFAGVEVGNHTITQRAAGANVLMRFLIHHFGFLSHGNHLVGLLVESNHRWLVHNNLTVASDDGVGSAKVHGNILCQRKKSHSSSFKLLMFVRIIQSSQMILITLITQNIQMIQKTPTIPIPPNSFI